MTIIGAPGTSPSPGSHRAQITNDHLTMFARAVGEMFPVDKGWAIEAIEKVANAVDTTLVRIKVDEFVAAAQNKSTADLQEAEQERRTLESRRLEAERWKRSQEQDYIDAVRYAAWAEAAEYAQALEDHRLKTEAEEAEIKEKLRHGKARRVPKRTLNRVRETET